MGMPEPEALVNLRQIKLVPNGRLFTSSLTV
jgi:hypothetical protein